MNNRAHPEVADGMRSSVLYSTENSTRFPRTERSKIIELGVRSLRNFFFEHLMATYAAALAYRGLFGLFPFLLILVALASALGFQEFLDRAMEHARAQSSVQQVPQQLEPVVEQGREQIQPLVRMIEHTQQRASGEILFFSIAVALWSVSAVARLRGRARAARPAPRAGHPQRGGV